MRITHIAIITLLGVVMGASVLSAEADFNDYMPLWDVWDYRGLNYELRTTTIDTLINTQNFVKLYYNGTMICNGCSIAELGTPGATTLFRTSGEYDHAPFYIDMEFTTATITVDELTPVENVTNITYNHLDELEITNIDGVMTTLTPTSHFAVSEYEQIDAKWGITPNRGTLLANSTNVIHTQVTEDGVDVTMLVIKVSPATYKLGEQLGLVSQTWQYIYDESGELTRTLVSTNHTDNDLISANTHETRPYVYKINDSGIAYYVDISVDDMSDQTNLPIQRAEYEAHLRDLQLKQDEIANIDTSVKSLQQRIVDAQATILILQDDRVERVIEQDDIQDKLDTKYTILSTLDPVAYPPTDPPDDEKE